MAQVRLAWDFPAGVSECTKFGIYGSDAQGNQGVRIAVMSGNVAPTEAAPFILNLGVGHYKLWVVPQNDFDQDLAAAASIEVDSTVPPVTNLRQV